MKEIRVEAYRTAVDMMGNDPSRWAPTTHETADHSLPYTIAIAFLDGAVNESSFESERFTEPADLGPLLRAIDGYRGTHAVRCALEVVPATTPADALDVLKAIHHNVEILAAVGTTTAQFDPADLDVRVNGVRVCAGGQPDQPRELVDLSGRAVTIGVDLKTGHEHATIWTNDLTTAYVHENSAYSS